MSGDPLDSEDRSEEAELMECSCTESVIWLFGLVCFIFISLSFSISKGRPLLKNAGGMWAASTTYIILGQEARAELQVVIQVKGPTSLEPGTESRHSRGFSQLPHALNSSKLALGVLGSHLGSSAGATPVVVIRRHVGSRAVVRVLLLLVLLLVEEGRHI